MLHFTDSKNPAFSYAQRNVIKLDLCITVLLNVGARCLRNLFTEAHSHF